MIPICGKAMGIGEGDHGDSGVCEVVEVVAHGDHMFLARQSGQMTVQHEHHRPTGLIGESPRAKVMVDQGDVGHLVAYVQSHGWILRFPIVMVM